MLRLKIHVRRPLCLLVLIYLLFLLLFQIVPSPEGPDLPEVAGRRLLLSGKVISKETNASGYRVLLSGIHFLPKEETGTGSEGSTAASAVKGSGQAAGSVYERLRRRLIKVWPEGGRVSVFLNAPAEGSAGVSVYGSQEKQSLWISKSKLVDQSDIYEKVKIGMQVTFYGKVSQPERATNPGQFDARRYNRARNIFLTMSEVRLRNLQPPARRSAIDSWLNFLADLRFLLKQSALSVFGEENAALIDAIVLGDRSGLDNGTRTLFQDGGILHILAVSSLHVTLLGMSLYKLLRKLRRSFVFSSVCSAFLVISFCLMTGSSFSAVRATVMFLFWLGARILGRTDDRLTSLAAAAFFILVRHPYALTDTGFLLSFSCILSIEILGPVFERIFSPADGLRKSLAGSLSLQAGILPLSLYFFYQTTPWGILLNLVVLPSMSLFMIFGVLGCLAGLLLHLSSLFLIPAKLIGGPCGILLSLFRLLCRIAQRLPGDILITGRPPLWKMFLYYSLLAALCIYAARMDKKHLARRRRQIRLCSSALLTGLFLLLVLHRQPDFRFTCLDIGQGSCNLVEQGGFVMLFDGGSSSVDDVYRCRIESTLKYYGISKIDLIFLSHGDIDHISGVSEMLESWHPGLMFRKAADKTNISEHGFCPGIFSGNAGGISAGRIIVPDLSSDPEEYSGLQDVIAKAKNCGIPVSSVSEGTTLSHGNTAGPSAGGKNTLTMHVLSPSQKRMTGETNQDCIVLLLQYGKLRILFTGDLEKEGEESFVESYRRSRFFSSPGKTTDILIAGHHGSKNATSGGLLDLVRPDLVLISCGRNNRYGHPAREMLERVSSHRIPFIRTDKAGAFRLKL